MMAQALGVRTSTLARWSRRQEIWKPPDRRGRPEVIDARSREHIRICYRSHFGQWGPQVLAAWCRREGLGDWSATTIAKVIEDLREPEEVEPPPARLEVTGRNVMWSEDGTGFRQRGRKKELLVVQDEHARLKLNWRLVDGPATADDVYYYLTEAFARHGTPLVLKHDGDAIFHTEAIRELLREHQVVELTAPAGYPRFNGKQERSMRDIKSYERALRRHHVGTSLASRVNLAMYDLNEERPRPVLGGRTAREAYDRGETPLPDRRAFRAAVDETEKELRQAAASRSEHQSARRRAIEHVLLRYGLLEMRGNVSTNSLVDGRTK
jgi:hypothetical protein